AALGRQSEQLQAYLAGAERAELADVAYTLAVGRKRFSERRYVVCRNYDEAIAALAGESLQTGPTHTDEPAVIFMFPGGGSQYVNMGRELYETEPFFREQVDICADLLLTQSGHDLLEFLYPKPEAVEAATVNLKKTPVALPALFAIEYALAKLWMSWGLNPSAMIGHSLGEYVAACLAGVFSLEEALALVLHRARLLVGLLPGVMLSVPLPEHEVKELIEGRLSLAAVNGPSQCVVSGAVAAIDELAALLEQREIEFHRLQIDAPGHSEMVNPILEPFAEFVRGLNLRPPTLPYISNVTGTWITDEQATDPEYWAAHLRQTVRFSEGIRQLLKKTDRQVFLEVGPGQTLCSLVKLNSPEHSSYVVSSLRHPREQRNDVDFLLNSLGRLWMLGAQIRFDNFYGAGCHRVPLPTYPFERQRYWMEPENGASARGNASLRKKADVADWFFCPAWKRSSWLGLTARESVKESWLIFADAVGIGSELVQRLREQGHEVSTVSIGDEFAATDGGNYHLRPAVADDYNALLEDLGRRELLPRKVVHLWGVSATPTEEGNSKDKGFYSLLWLAQAFSHRQLSDGVHWTVVTNGVQVITGDEDVAPVKAMALGLCKVIPLEYPNISCRTIDLVLPESSSARSKLIARLANDSAGNGAGETTVAYRGSYRWVEMFEPVHLEPSSDGPLRLRERGVYVITGGLGQVGLLLAGYLARTVRARLALIGRTPLPERSLWEEYIRTHDEADHVAQSVRRLLQLEEHGAEVLYISADVANEEQMREAVASIRNHYHALHGVLHCAGTKIFKTVQEIERDECEEQFRAKVEGLLTLEKTLEECELDFCLLFSSLSSVLGVVSLAAYPAAHIYMDAFVHQHNRTHETQWMSIGWDNWGAALGTGRISEESALFMKREEAEKVLDRIFSLEPVARLLVSTADLEARVNKWIKREFLSERRTFASLASSADAPRPVLRKSYVAPRNEVEKTLAAIWQQTLGIAQVGIADNYFDLGGDSVLAIHIVARAKQQGISLAPKQLFFHQTIAELALAADTGPLTLASQETVTGEVLLTPIQRWFFEQDLSDPHHWNLALFLEMRERPGATVLTAMVKSLLAHHDALRMRYERSETEWKQVNAGLDEATPVIRIDLSDLPPASQALVVERTANELQTSLCLAHGPLLRLAHFDFGEEQSGRLLVILHHLVVDAVSLRILLDDMQKIFRQLQQEQSVELAPKTTSFQRWAECLHEYAVSERLEKESDYWLSLPWDEVRPLPLDQQRGPNTFGSARTISSSLSAEQTRSVLQSLPRDLNVHINDLLLTALARSLWSWIESSAVVIDLEGHGREDITEGVDLSRTVGWFTTTAPLMLRRSGGSVVDQLKLVKDELRAVPVNGIGFGVLRYLGEPSLAHRLRALPQAQLSFVYLGQFDHVLTASPFVITSGSVGATRSHASVRPYLIEIVSLVREGQLHINWMYSENFHRHTTIENLARRFQESLQELIAAAQTTTQVIYTPADFPGADLNQEQLDQIMARIS
ncbi:MAG TPA: SDR family NAD(P)-dependent oxidoreductase, partial [Pyrinomonadaceae bacterium]